MVYRTTGGYISFGKGAKKIMKALKKKIKNESTITTKSIDDPKIKRGTPVRITPECEHPHLWGKTGKYYEEEFSPTGTFHVIVMDDPDTATAIHRTNIYRLKLNEFELIAVLADKNATEKLIDLQNEPNFVDLRKKPVDIRNQHHYARFKIQPVVFIMANNLNYEQGAIIKYIMRYDEKNGLEDLEKARHYLDMMIQKVKGEYIKP